FYSVAQHSVILSDHFFAGWQYRLVALLHDASEAYLTDIPRPLKQLDEFKFYREAEWQLQVMIYEKFCGPGWQPIAAEVEKWDRQMITHEAKSLMVPIHPDFQLPEVTVPLLEIEPQIPSVAKSTFLHRFNNLTSRRMEKVASL